MFPTALPDEPLAPDPSCVGDQEVDPVSVREELRRIVASRSFQASRRGKEFLQYVVNQTIDGHGHLLKERLIGIQLFGRRPDYSTGEDPVVRVQAGDVRHRLERYYGDPDCHAAIEIRIPLGSYAPVFRMRPSEVGAAGLTAEQCDTSDRLPANTLENRRESIAAAAGADSTQGEADALPVAPQSATLRIHNDSAAFDSGTVPAPHRAGVSLPRRWLTHKRVLLALSVGVCLAALAAVLWLHRDSSAMTRAFWSPVTDTPKPVLLWLPKPMVYKPSAKLFAKYGESHPNALVTRESRQDEYLPLQPTDTIEWRDMIPVYDSGPGIGGVVAAVEMSRLLTERGVRFKIRFGPEATYAEMREAPAIIVGAINTKWATQLTSESHFAFDESIAAPGIYETGGAKRTWKMQKTDGHVLRDYGLITRQLSGKSGQFVLQVAGITHFGTEASSELLLDTEAMTKVLRSNPVSLQDKNLQIVISTDITNESAGPPHIVAVDSW